jgi:oligopeptide transport system substrate-binding protein
VGNGAFVLDKWVLNKLISMKKNPNYWDAANVKLEGANFHAIEDNSSEEKAFRAGKLHTTNEVPIEKVPFWQKDQTGVYVEAPYNGIYFYRFNTTRKPLNDGRVRKALRLGIDREKMVNYVTKAGQIPATAFTPPGAGGYQPKAYLPKDASGVTEAKKLLALAGYPNGKGFPKLQILYNTTEGHKKIAEAIQQMWKENLGIDVELFNQEWKVYLESTRKLHYDMSRAGWIADYNDPNTFLDMWVTDRGNNETGWSNKKYDELLYKASMEHNPAKRMDYFQQAEAILMDDGPVMPIYVYTRVYLKDKTVQGWFPNIMDFHPLKYVTLEAQSKS